MEDVSLHSPVVRSYGQTAPSDMGQYTYEDEGEPYTPRRIWPTPQRYAARILAPSAPPAPPSRQPAVSHQTVVALTVLGLVIFTCSTASLVVVALLMDSTRGQVNSAAGRIAEALDALADNQTQLARLVSLMEAWLGNSTRQAAWGPNPLPGGY